MHKLTRFRCKKVVSSLVVIAVIIQIGTLVILNTRHVHLTKTTEGLNSITSQSGQGHTNRTEFYMPPKVAKFETINTKCKIGRSHIQDKEILCYKPHSRLGNHMFQYASAYGISVHLNRSLVFQDPMISGYFNLRGISITDLNCVARESTTYLSKWNCSFDGDLMNLPNGGPVCVGMFLQSYKYFEHVESDIKRQFTFRQAHRDKASVLLEKAVATYKKRLNITYSKFRPVTIGVHVRRGDMVRMHRYGFDVATPSYLKKATNYFRDKFKSVLFVVCSNDMDWVRLHVRGDDVILVDEPHFVVAMALLVSCDHTLMTVGTFGWWVGYLNSGETVYYQWPAREGTRYRREFSFDFSDFYPKSWIGMTG